MPRGRTVSVLVQRSDDTGVRRTPDVLAVEEPMEIHLDGALVSTTMRTPGHDFELAAGFLHGEGMLGGHRVLGVRYCATGSAADTGFNVVTVDTGGAAPVPTARLTTTTSACGLCGSATLIDDLQARLPPIAAPHRFATALMATVPARVRERQELFAATGAVHAAAAFDADGEPVVVREDVGRHNAVDKVVGRLLFDGRLPATGLGLFVSGRAGTELVQKAWAAGFSALVAVGAPTSLAVEIATAGGLQLAGFVRDGSVNVYTPVSTPD